MCASDDYKINFYSVSSSLSYFSVFESAKVAAIFLYPSSKLFDSLYGFIAAVLGSSTVPHSSWIQFKSLLLVRFWSDLSLQPIPWTRAELLGIIVPAPTLTSYSRLNITAIQTIAIIIRSSENHKCIVSDEFTSGLLLDMNIPK